MYALGIVHNKRHESSKVNALFFVSLSCVFVSGAYVNITFFMEKHATKVEVEMLTYRRCGNGD